MRDSFSEWNHNAGREMEISLMSVSPRNSERDEFTLNSSVYKG